MGQRGNVVKIGSFSIYPYIHFTPPVHSIKCNLRAVEIVRGVGGPLSPTFCSHSGSTPQKQVEILKVCSDFLQSGNSMDSLSLSHTLKTAVFTQDLTFLGLIEVKYSDDTRPSAGVRSLKATTQWVFCKQLQVPRSLSTQFSWVWVGLP
eukprot:1137971-Pelagomonas_calceolata.AAC.3